MPKVTLKDKKPGRSSERKVIVAKTTDVKKDEAGKTYKWWTAANNKDLANQLISTADYLQKNQQYRVKQASIYSRVYNGKPLMNYALNSKVMDTSNQMPLNRPTLNVSASCVDTIVSRITQSKPKPVFLTDDGNYKEQTLAKQMKAFIGGEFYRCKTYEKTKEMLRKGCIIGDGIIKTFERDKKVAQESVLATELFVDPNDAYYGNPRAMIQVMLCDREVAIGQYPEYEKEIDTAMKAYVDGSAQSSQTTSDQIIVVEGWRIPSFVGANDGLRAVACSAGFIGSEVWKKDYFPFDKLSYQDPFVGWFGQGLVELGLGMQIAINKLLITMDMSQGLVGVPRIFIDEMSKVLETSFNNNVGSIIKYRGTMPQYSVAQCMPPEMYEHLMRLISLYYQQIGMSQLTSGGVKPPGMNSGEAQRVFLQTQDDRFADLEEKYDNIHISLAYKAIDVAKDIAERDGKYSTIYPDKDGTREIDLPKAAILKDSYYIRCYDESSLPDDPSGRYAQLSEMLAGGEISLEEFRDLQGLPDLSESDKLANALRNRIKKILYGIVEDGDFTPPDTFLLDPTSLAVSLTVNFINLYSTAKLEEKRMQMLRDFLTQVQNLQMQATAPPPAPMPEPNAAIQNPAPAPPPTPMSPTSAA